MPSLARAIFTVIVVSALGCRNARSPAIESSSAAGEQLVRITAKRFEYSPAEVHVRRGVPVVLELTSLDHVHGIAAPDLAVRSDIPPDVITRVRFVPERSGRFPFHCDVFCGSGHEDMSGEIVVDD
jgi:cytochrome c oxidase subunit 2